MRGDTHVRFGGRARETDPGQPGHRARARPNRSDTSVSCPPADHRWSATQPEFWNPTRHPPGIRPGRHRPTDRCVADPAERTCSQTSLDDAHRHFRFRNWFMGALQMESGNRGIGESRTALARHQELSKIRLLKTPQHCLVNLRYTMVELSRQLREAPVSVLRALE